ncbi:2-dehydro-3-deoxygluconokinase [Thalassobacillus devorans]|uniref:2-dehydro-3-deoxygluconokinase n=1 Tax=Thalassobacillus devorans TaxID=279813 RepID=A0ABQ1NSA2_9BACI|nr:sugar kinase [Thalassobacillus devorans]NIK28722.1 2-dehydro-3-deoxygluconokinase [Thalassobacillus devorans]GGC84059.1 2-dehydro-3-deoxygluconokinase [Thalassobacillus devorans]
MKADVVTIGESMVLFQPYTEGTINYTPLLSKSVGGAESNLAFGLSRLGKKVRWISRLGSDPFGDLILATLSGEGVDISYAKRDDNAPTALYFKESKGYGDPNVFYYRKHSAASKLSSEDIEASWLDDARHLHMTGITPALGENTADFTREVMKRAREKGMTISFDPNLRRKLWSDEQAREVLLSLIPLCDIFLPGIEEAEFLLGEKTKEQYGKSFLDMGASVVAMKLGAEGSLGFFQDEVVNVAPYKVDKVIDTVGAGDAFAAGFLSRVLDEENPLAFYEMKHFLPEALKRANVMGALATQFKGDWEGAPTLEEVSGLMGGKQMVTR